MRTALVLAMLIYAQSFPAPGPGTHGAAPVGPTIAITSATCAGTSPGHNTDTCTLGATAAVGDLYVVASKTDSTSATASIAYSSSACTLVPSIAPTFQTNGSGKFNYAQAACIVTTAIADAPLVTWTGAGVDNGFTDIQAFTVHTSNTWKTTFLDQKATNVAATTSTSCATGTTAATTNANDWLLATCSVFNVGQTQGSLSGYTSLTTVSSTTVLNYGKSVTSTGTQAATVPLSGSDFGLGAIVAYASN